MHLNAKITSFTILTIGILFCTVIVTNSWKGINNSHQTIAAVGSAKTLIHSNLAILKGSIVLTVSNPKDAYVQLTPQLEMVLSFLEKKGVKRKEIELFPATQFSNYEFSQEGYQTGKIVSYTVSQGFKLTTQNVNLVKDLSLQITELLSEGVLLQMERPEYIYTKLADIKINIQSLAATDAQLRAETMVKATGQQLGAMRSAKMGVIQITPPNSTTVTDYGMNDVSSIEKEITAVVHASFEID